LLFQRGDRSLICTPPEFRSFVEETEKELLHLFKSIDHNNDGKISKPELRAALSRAGLAVPNSNLDNFFAEVDTNNDGTISFEEWRYVKQWRWTDPAWLRQRFWRSRDSRRGEGCH
jgi:hypothetical protein